MNIGEASQLSGLPSKTIRYYEEIGLVLADRKDNGYRSYDETHVHKLKFLKRSRSLGFGIDECRQLLSLYEDKHRTSATVRTIAESKLSEIDLKIEEMMGLRQTLATLVDACHGDDRPDCPILNDLSGDSI